MANRPALIALYRDLAEKLRATPRQPLSTRDQERAAARPYGEQTGFIALYRDLAEKLRAQGRSYKKRFVAAVRYRRPLRRHHC